jgi:hypothetical protein
MFYVQEEYSLIRVGKDVFSRDAENVKPMLQR